MTGLSPEISNYFDAFESAFNGLEAIAETEGDERRRHNFLYQAIEAPITRLRHSIACWKLKCRFADQFSIDRSESGFPLFKNVLELETDMNRVKEHLLDLPTGEQTRVEMLELMLKFQQHPGDLQKVMARRLYYEALDEARAFTTFTKPATLRVSVNPRSGRTYYVVTWSTYDGTENLPLVYVAVIEDSSEDAPRPRRNTPHGFPKGWIDEMAMNGLPNLSLRSEFKDFVAAHSSYSLSLTTIAKSIDETFPTLHPKQLRRFVLGPFYAGGLTDHNKKVQSVLDSVSSPSDNWLFTWTMQELHSKHEVRSKMGIWGSSPAREIYHVNTDDLDCVAQGVSALERYAMIPHTAYQSMYAKNLTDEIFNGHRCYIASGDHILKHV